MDRLIARENNIIESKRITKIFPTTDNIVVIFDDRRGAWDENDTSENLINLYPYYFFYDKCMHAI